jgi:HEAT repeat protein
LGEADAERALEAARPLVNHADGAIACAAVEAIGNLRASGQSGRLPVRLMPACEDALFVALDHPQEEVVKLALALIGTHPGARALARLGLCLDHASWEVRRLAAELLGQAMTPAAQSLLRARYERERDPIVREAIASAVSLRPPGDGARPSDWAEPTSLPQGSKAGE